MNQAPKAPFGDPNLKWAESDQVFTYETAVDKILEAIGYPDAIVTDRSQLGDFPLEDEDFKELSDKFGFEVNGNSYIADVAKKLSWPEIIEEDKHMT